MCKNRMCAKNLTIKTKGHIAQVSVARWGFILAIFIDGNERVNKLHFPSHTMEFTRNFLFSIDHPHNVLPYTAYIPFLYNLPAIVIIVFVHLNLKLPMS